MPVEAEAAHDRALEVADQPVGEDERRRALLADALEKFRAGQHLVAVRAAHARGADLIEDRFQLSVHAAVAVDDDEVVVARPQLAQLLAQLVDDAIRVQVQQRRDAVDVHVPAAAVDDVLDLFAQGAADDKGRAHPTSSRSGKRRTSTNASLKSERPESSTYSILDGSSKATCRSRYDSSAILAPSPAELPTAMIRSTSTSGTSPMILALSGLRYDPNDPPR